MLRMSAALVPYGHAIEKACLTQKEIEEIKESELKAKYLSELKAPCDKNRWDSVDPLEHLIEDLPIEQATLVHKTLIDVFTQACSNSERVKIIRLLLGVSEDQWPVIMQQACFIMPRGTHGHDLGWAIEILIKIPSLEFREQLVNTANRFFKYNTCTTEKGRILQALATLDSEGLSKMDRAEQEERDSFIEKQGSN